MGCVRILVMMTELLLWKTVKETIFPYKTFTCRSDHQLDCTLKLKSKCSILKVRSMIRRYEEVCHCLLVITKFAGTPRKGTSKIFFGPYLQVYVKASPTGSRLKWQASTHVTGHIFLMLCCEPATPHTASQLQNRNTNTKLLLLPEESSISKTPCISFPQSLQTAEETLPNISVSHIHIEVYPE
jgi:hypothetical protein